MTKKQGPEFETRPEIESTKTIEQEPVKSKVIAFFERFSNPDSLAKITPEDVTSIVPEIISELKEAGWNLEPLKEDKNQALLKEKKCRRFTAGNSSKGVVATQIFDRQTPTTGNELLNCPNTLAFLAKSQEICKDRSTLIGAPESSKRRAVEQFVLNTLAVASGAITAEDYLQKRIKWPMGAFKEGKLMDEHSAAKKAGLLTKSELWDALKAHRVLYEIPEVANMVAREEYKAAPKKTLKPKMMVDSWTFITKELPNMSDSDKANLIRQCTPDILLGNDSAASDED